MTVEGNLEAVTATPLSLFPSGGTIIKLLEISTKKNLITKRNR